MLNIYPLPECCLLSPPTKLAKFLKYSAITSGLADKGSGVETREQ